MKGMMGGGAEDPPTVTLYDMDFDVSAGIGKWRRGVPQGKEVRGGANITRQRRRATTTCYANPCDAERANVLRDYVEEEHKVHFANKCIIKEGTWIKYDRGGGKSKPHMFLTASDLLMTELTTISRKIKFRQVFKLVDVRVKLE